MGYWAVYRKLENGGSIGIGRAQNGELAYTDRKDEFVKLADQESAEWLAELARRTMRIYRGQTTEVFVGQI